MVAAATNQSEPLELIRQWISRRLGIHYTENKLDALYHRLQALCRKVNIDDLDGLHKALIEGSIPNLNIQMAQMVSINHTLFFRESEVLRYFEETIIPSLPEDSPIRLWCAAVSSGEEAYTLAMMLSERIGLESKRLSILGTDISQKVIRDAELGVYSQERLQTIPNNFREKYFRRVGMGQGKISPEIRELCLFRRLNLTSSPWPFQQKFHVIFCRNVLYYFERNQQREVIQRIYDQAMPGAWLVTSVTEPLRELDLPWDPVVPGVYRRRD